jgi:hypothetical protein
MSNGEIISIDNPTSINAYLSVDGWHYIYATYDGITLNLDPKMDAPTSGRSHFDSLFGGKPWAYIGSVRVKNSQIIPFQQRGNFFRYLTHNQTTEYEVQKNSFSSTSGYIFSTPYDFAPDFANETHLRSVFEYPSTMSPGTGNSCKGDLYLQLTPNDMDFATHRFQISDPATGPIEESKSLVVPDIDTFQLKVFTLSSSGCDASFTWKLFVTGWSDPFIQ